MDPSESEEQSFIGKKKVTGGWGGDLPQSVMQPPPALETDLATKGAKLRVLPFLL